MSQGSLSNGYEIALEQVESIYERLFMKKRLCKDCRTCPLILEIAKLRQLAKDGRVEALETELGYYLD